MSVDDDEGLIDRCGCERFKIIHQKSGENNFPLFSPDAHLDVTPADVLLTRVDRKVAHVAIALNRESVLERRTKILKRTKWKSINNFVYKQIINSVYCQLLAERQMLKNGRK